MIYCPPRENYPYFPQNSHHLPLPSTIFAHNLRMSSSSYPEFPSLPLALIQETCAERQINASVPSHQTQLPLNRPLTMPRFPSAWVWTKSPIPFPQTSPRCPILNVRHQRGLLPYARPPRTAPRPNDLLLGPHPHSSLPTTPTGMRTSPPSASQPPLRRRHTAFVCLDDSLISTHLNRHQTGTASQRADQSAVGSHSIVKVDPP